MLKLNLKPRTTLRRPMPRPTVALPVEKLESRQLFSALSGILIQPGVQVLRSASVSNSVDGLTPAQTKTAYGFNNIKFDNGTVTGDGTGQTIAIVDAFNDPNVVGDLNVFDQQFNLPAANLKIVNQTGGSSLPSTQSSWASEIALDVEWAHAIAPGAKILLVETNTDDLVNLLAGVKYARTVAGVSAVSLSWGGSEGGSFDGSAASQIADDAIFTTPSGHTGITFLAASGDEGSRSGPDWPASSSNVVAVGGTSLGTDDSGNYTGESAWSDSTGGYSTIESEPAYQQAVQSTGHRSNADVSYDADPNSGFAVYDSLPDGGESGWQVVGGTSAGTPQWAALVAIADQGRVLNGLGTLDGASQTLPMLYSLYGAPGSSAYSTYTNYFNDITTGGSFGGPRGGGSRAAEGYDTVTGLGTPKADAIVGVLAGTSSGGTTGGGGGTTGGGGGSTTTLPASSVTATFVSNLPDSVVSGAGGTLKLRLTNTESTRFVGKVLITLSASTDNVASSDDATIKTVTTPSVSLNPGQSKLVTIKYTYASSLAAGNYFLIASTNETFGTTTAVATPSNNALDITPATVDLSTAFASSPVSESATGTGVALVKITNLGNALAAGTVSVLLHTSNDGSIAAADTLVGSISQRRISLKAGKSITLKIKFVDSSPGSSFIVASTTSTTTIADTDTSDDSDSASLV